MEKFSQAAGLCNYTWLIHTMIKKKDSFPLSKKVRQCFNLYCLLSHSWDSVTKTQGNMWKDLFINNFWLQVLHKVIKLKETSIIFFKFVTYANLDLMYNKVKCNYFVNTINLLTWSYINKARYVQDTMLIRSEWRQHQSKLIRLNFLEAF